VPAAAVVCGSAAAGAASAADKLGIAKARIAADHASRRKNRFMGRATEEQESTLSKRLPNSALK
jgi:hypothetical protein